MLAGTFASKKRCLELYGERSRGREASGRLLRLDDLELRGRRLLAGLMKLLAGGRFWLEAKMSEG